MARLFGDIYLRVENEKFYDLDADVSWCRHDIETDLVNKYSCTVVTPKTKLIKSFAMFKAQYQYSDVVCLINDSGTPMFLVDSPSGRMWAAINNCSYSGFHKTVDGAVKYALELREEGTWFANKYRNCELIIFPSQKDAFEYCSKYIFKSSESRES